MNTYSVSQIAINEFGCTDTSTIDLLVEGIIEPILPSAFTPNKDGQNDEFKVRGGPFESVDLKIFNSWGKMVFDSNGTEEGWDGKYKGKEQPIGVYIYVVKVVTIDGKEFEKKGDFTLLR